ncbi:DMT family transporter [Lichenifustis flavocetrariae]|uniref:DMT family transporter n=1 Tax=Lichenifustis flavocetrariae TaxID=2949735 RepID=A0AA41YWD2_9HYPH|nr:DMT family transporter [Lichenifustis flavocetrariae]MCW6508520.1 DMT family transporter [Lichenifustis flavocetrariae]
MTPEATASRQTSLAISLFSAGVFFFAVNDALGKWLVTGYPVGEIMLIRSCGAGLFLVPMLVRDPASLRRPNQLGLHAIRVLIMAGDSFAFYFATRSLPLADVMTFYLAAPLLVTLLAMLTLREPIGPWKALAVVVGFAGVVVALHPSGASLSPAAFIALAGSLMFATAIVITRGLRQTHWLSLVAWQFMGAAVVGAVTSLGAWVQPSLLDCGLMLLVGFISMICFISINKALSLAQASVLAPFHYTSIIWAVLLGWLIWGDIPTHEMCIGIGLIVASGALVWLRERLAPQDPHCEAPIA